MPQKNWYRISVRTPSGLAETVASHLTDITGFGTEIRDPAEPDGQCEVLAYLDETAPDLSDKLSSIKTILVDLTTAQYAGNTLEMALESIPEEDWNLKWREGLKPFHLTSNLVIKPSWEIYSPSGNEKVIEMDPGQAFGTGLHTSTRLIVELLEEYLPPLPTPPQHVLDIGTGTGILAICAVLLGCRSAVGIDIDSAAIEAAQTNIANNGLANRISVSESSLLDLQGQYDLIMANIIHNTLLEMSPRLNTLLTKGGLLLLSGILRGGQTENIINHYSANSLQPIRVLESGEWAAVCLRKP